MKNPFRYFNSSPEISGLAVMMYVRFPLSLRQVEDLLSERGIDICHETVRYLWNRFGSLFAAEIRQRRVHRHCDSNWCWHLDEVFVRINGKICSLWRAVDHEGEVLEDFATKRRDRRAALRFLERAMKRYGRPASIVKDGLPSYRAAMTVIGNAIARTCGRWLNNRAENDEQMTHDFIDAWLAPETGKFLIETYGYGHGNARSFDHVDSKTLVALGYDDPVRLMEGTSFWVLLDPAMDQLMTETWENVSAGL